MQYMQVYPTPDIHCKLSNKNSYKILQTDCNSKPNEIVNNLIDQSKK